MQFVVRYWSSHLSDAHVGPDGNPLLVDYSTHPPTKLGLHNALLSVRDRSEILASYGGRYACEVFVVEGHRADVLTQEMAVGLFYGLPDGEVRWTTLQEFLLPQNRRAAPVATQINYTHERQMQLFEYTHVPEDDVAPGHLSINA